MRAKLTDRYNLILGLLVFLGSSQLFAVTEHSLKTLKLILSEDGNITGDDLIELISDLGGKFLEKKDANWGELAFFSIPNLKKPGQPLEEWNTGFPQGNDFFHPMQLLWVKCALDVRGITTSAFLEIIEKKSTAAQ